MLVRDYWKIPEIKYLGEMMKRVLSVPEKHQLKIARKTLRMPDAVADYLSAVSNSPSKLEAREIIRKLTGKN
jgi:hypothetical protein